MRTRGLLILSSLSISPLLLYYAESALWPLSLLVNFIPQASFTLFLIGLIFLFRKRRIASPLALIPFAGSVMAILILQINVQTLEKSDPRQNQHILSVLQLNLQYNEKGMRRLFSTLEKLKPDVIVLTELPSSLLALDENLSVEDVRSALPQEIATTYSWLSQSEADGRTRTLILSRLEIIADQAFSKNIARATIQHPNGVELNIFGIHPPPPLKPLWAFRRDGLIEKTFAYAASSQTPSLVVGDFNAVPWSRSILTPARQYKMARSEHNIFKNTWLMQWGPIALPIDHIYGTREIRVRNRKTLSHIGSDHLPIYTELVITP